jgi:peptidoglycan/xylan/chitin deacetylase (PgdA/CDA1 family)
MAAWLGTHGVRSPSALSRGEFGPRVGLPRVLAFLELEGITATFFVPGHTIETYPALSQDIVRRGHEIGHHGYLHERPVGLTRAEEGAALDRGLEALERTVGVRPSGYRAPGWELSDNTVSLLLERGFAYESSMMAQDFEFYRCRLGDEPTTDGPFVFGTEIDLVECPVSWSLDDMPQMEHSRPPLPPFQGLTSYETTLSLWCADFDYMVEYVTGGAFVLTLHPEVIGRGARMRVLEGLVRHMKSVTDVRFACLNEAVRDWRAANPIPLAMPSDAQG